MGIVNAVSAINSVNGHCRTNKKCFASEQDAATFEAKNRATYGSVKQYAYACEECDSYHLSCYSPDAKAVTNYSKIANSRTAEQVEKWRRLTDQERQQIVILGKQGLTVKKIAETVKTSIGTVSKHLRQHDDAAKFQPPTVDSLASEEKQLEEKLLRVKQERLRLIELNAVKVAKLVDGQISIRKGTQVMMLSVDDGLEVTVKLTEILGV